MGKYFNDKNANALYESVYKELLCNGNVEVGGRNGTIKELLHVSLTLENPKQRWVSYRKPAISPAFSFAELITIMNGCDEADILNKWNPALSKYQGEYTKYPGAYGTRLRKSFGFDQLTRAYEALKNNHSSRQIVLEIWKPELDLPLHNGIPNNDDIPCNICSLLKVRDGKLYWTQVMRSNDIFLGLPYNILQFTSLQEIMAGWLGLDLGEYMHISDSMHYYEDNIMSIEMQEKISNTDDLRLNIDESEEVFCVLFEKMKNLGEGKNINFWVEKELISQILPEAYNNILMILCIYALQKNHGNRKLMLECEKRCTNKLFVQMMKRWQER